MKVVALYYTTN